MHSVTVLLSTYNGERFLRAQLDSLMAQQGVELRVLARDDGSRDATAEILKDYAQRFPGFCFLNPDKQENLGITRSFLTLLCSALEEDAPAEYFAFCDQDDVWLPDKLLRAVCCLSAEEESPEAPALYYSNKTVCDGALKVLQEEKLTVFHDFAEVLQHAWAWGLTEVFSRGLGRLAVSPLPTCSCYHDAWLFRLARSVHAAVVFDEESRVLYRQHGGNAVGYVDQVKENAPSGASVLKRLGNLLRPSSRNGYLQSFMQEIWDTHREQLGAAEARIIDDFLRYDKNLFCKLRLMLLPDIKKRDRAFRLRWMKDILLNRF